MAISRVYMSKDLRDRDARLLEKEGRTCVERTEHADQWFPVGKLQDWHGEEFPPMQLFSKLYHVDA